MRTAAYPGSFDPPTIAHLAVAEAAFGQLGVDRVELVISVDPLGKDAAGQVRVADRLAVLEAVAATRPWMGVATTAHRLIADIAAAYDAIVMGADKWAQVLDPTWYGGSTEARDRAVAGLGVIGLAPRSGTTDADADADAGDGSPATMTGILVVDLDLHPSHRSVSATSVRSGRREWMAVEAAAFDERTGAWSDPDRYARWVAASTAGAGSPDRDHDGGHAHRGMA